MKFGILVHDLTCNEASEILEKLKLGAEYKVAVIDSEDDEQGLPATSEFDTTGLPWDERIHAGSKTQNKDGTWKKRKGVQPIIFDQIENEIRMAMPTSAPVAMPVTAAVVEATPTIAPVAMPIPVAAPMVAPTAPVMTQAPAPMPMPTPMPAPMPMPVATPISRDFQGLMLQISNLYRDEKITDALYPNTIVSRINDGFQANVVAITDIATNPAFVDYAWQCLEIDGLGA